MGSPCQEQGPGKGPPCSWNLALSSFHPAQRARPLGPQALWGKPWGCRGKGCRDFDPDSHFRGYTAPSQLDPHPAFGPLEKGTEWAQLRRRPGWGARELSLQEALPGGGGQCTQGWAVDAGAGVLYCTRPMVTAGTKADRSSSGLSCAGGWGEGRG